VFGLIKFIKIFTSGEPKVDNTDALRLLSPIHVYTSILVIRCSVSVIAVFRAYMCYSHSLF